VGEDGQIVEGPDILVIGCLTRKGERRVSGDGFDEEAKEGRDAAGYIDHDALDRGFDINAAGHNCGPGPSTPTPGCADFGDS
jgi:hypothetical protein